MKMKQTISLLGLALLLIAGTASAMTNNATGDYSLTLVDGCAIDASGASTNFGTFPVDSDMLVGVSAGSIAVNCTTDTPYLVGMGGGLHPDFMGPTMMEPISWAQIEYSILVNGMLFGDFDLSMVDGSYIETNQSGNPIMDIGTSTPKIYNLTAEIYLDPMLGFPAGTYTDTVTFTVAW
ncbi:MAG: spore coat U domain-containing protein [Desulfobulbaceae bacterium]|nr:spore coat U domain-containing protein [Desulfobulbaceae bacterium]